MTESHRVRTTQEGAQQGPSAARCSHRINKTTSTRRHKTASQEEKTGAGVLEEEAQITTARISVTLSCE